MPTEDSNVGVYALKGDVERAGLTAVGFSLGVRRLMAKGLVEATIAYDQGVTDAGWRWIDANGGPQRVSSLTIGAVAGCYRSWSRSRVYVLTRKPAKLWAGRWLPITSRY